MTNLTDLLTYLAAVWPYGVLALAFLACVAVYEYYRDM